MAYRCYLLRRGRIVAGADLMADRLEDAVTAGHAMLAADPYAGTLSGFEIWRAASLLHVAAVGPAERLVAAPGANTGARVSDPG